MEELFMKIRVLRTISIISVLTLVVSLCSTSAFAISVERQKSATNFETHFDYAKAQEINSMSDEALRFYLFDTYDVSEADVDAFVALKNNRNGVMRRSGFPSNPYIGQVYKMPTVRIYKEDLNLDDNATILELAGTFAAKWNWEVGFALAAAGAVLELVDNNVEFKWVEFTQTFVYGITNDGVYGWNYGPWEFDYG